MTAKEAKERYAKPIGIGTLGIVVGMLGTLFVIARVPISFAHGQGTNEQRLKAVEEALPAVKEELRSEAKEAVSSLETRMIRAFGEFKTEVRDNTARLEGKIDTLIWRSVPSGEIR